jgi:DNA-binding protein HU-beta
MYKTQLVKKVAQETRVSQKLTALILNTTLKTIQETLGQHREVRLPGFGSFYTRKRPASKGTNFKTGKSLVVPARKVPSFKAGALLKRKVRQGKPPKKKTTGRKKKK